MTKNIIIKTSVQKRFDSFMVHGRVLFFSAPCGFGKTVLADALLRGRNVLRQSAADPDCAIAESKFEKGEDVTWRMLSLLPQLNEVRNRGTPDMEFAVSGLLARSQLANGQAMDARRTIEVLRECFAERGLTRFLPNMDAMLCRIDMHTGDLDAADAWYREKAPREPTHLNVMRRYQYLTQAMVELADAGGVLPAFPRTPPCPQ